MSSAERYRQNADDCRQRSLQARTPAEKSNWLKIAEEWLALVESFEFTNALDRLKANGK
jgi:hypothetical protein